VGTDDRDPVVTGFAPDRFGRLWARSQVDPEYVLVLISPRGERGLLLVLAVGVVVPTGDVFGDALVSVSGPGDDYLTVMIVREPIEFGQFDAVVRVLRGAADEAVREATEGQ
jgi:hypothetical protein